MSKYNYPTAYSEILFCRLTKFHDVCIIKQQFAWVENILESEVRTTLIENFANIHKKKALTKES